jgi:PGF-CTERM protein
MRPDALLATGAVVALIALVALATLVPGFLADPTVDDQPPARFDVAEMTLSAGEVTGETATLETSVYVDHRGGPADNVTVVTRATSDSGLVVDTATRTLGAVEGGGEREVRTAITVPRESGYEVRTILYVDGERADTARATVSGVGALTPPHARSNVEFHRFHRQPSVEYTVRSAGDDRVTLEVSSYLTNTGDEADSDLRLVVTARQADANVVAARAERAVGTVEQGRTATPAVELTVPDGYNYYLDATLWRDGVVLESTRAAANLDPQETVAVNESRGEVTFRASDFETGPPDRPGGSPDAEESSDDGAGLGAAVAVVALLSALVATRRWSA